MGKKSPSTTSSKRSAKLKPAASGSRRGKSKERGRPALTGKSARGKSARRYSVTYAKGAWRKGTFQEMSDLLKPVLSGGLAFYSQGLHAPGKPLPPTTVESRGASQKPRKRTRTGL